MHLKRILLISAPSRDETNNEWNEAAIAEVGIPRAALLEALKSSDDEASAAVVVWSS